MFVSEFVELENGKTPFKDFLEELSDNERAEILAAIDKFIDYKNLNLRPPEKLSKFVEKGLFELKVNHLNK